MNKLNPETTAHRYFEALELVKKLTQNPNGAKIKTVQFCKEHKLIDSFFIITAKQRDILKREKTVTEGERAASYAYIWNYGDKPITPKLAEDIYEQCKNWGKRNNEDRDKTKTGAVVPTPPVNAAKPKEAVFTPKHLKIVGKLEFKAPTDLEIDECITLSDVREVTFAVDQSTVTLKVSVQRFIMIDERDAIELTQIYAQGFTNKNFILSPRFASEHQGAYKIKSVNANTNN